MFMKAKDVKWKILVKLVKLMLLNVVKYHCNLSEC